MLAAGQTKTGLPLVSQCVAGVRTQAGCWVGQTGPGHWLKNAPAKEAKKKLKGSEKRRAECYLSFLADPMGRSIKIH